MRCSCLSRASDSVILPNDSYVQAQLLTDFVLSNDLENGMISDSILSSICNTLANIRGDVTPSWLLPYLVPHCHLAALPPAQHGCERGQIPLLAPGGHVLPQAVRNLERDRREHFLHVFLKKEQRKGVQGEVGWRVEGQGGGGGFSKCVTSKA